MSYEEILLSAELEAAEVELETATLELDCRRDLMRAARGVAARHDAYQRVVEQERRVQPLRARVLALRARSGNRRHLSVVRGKK